MDRVPVRREPVALPHIDAAHHDGADGLTATRVLADRVPRLTAVEVDPALADELEHALGDRVTVVRGDGAALPFPDGSFSAVVCFTMLHHIPSHEQQDQLFAEACRVLRPGGVLAGSDSRMSFRFRLLHLGDTMVVVSPGTAGARLERAGFTDAAVELAARPGRSFRFSARKP